MDLAVGDVDRASGGVAKRLSRRMDTMSILMRRWGGCWIDFIAIVLMVAVVWFALQWAPPGLLGIITAVIVLGYYPVMEAGWGRTLGKFVTGTIVVDEFGQIPRIGPVLLRTLLRLVEVDPFLVGGIPAGIAVLASKHKQRLGDMAANTYVVLVQDLERAKHSNPIHDVFD